MAYCKPRLIMTKKGLETGIWIYSLNIWIYDYLGISYVWGITSISKGEFQDKTSKEKKKRKC